jgi:hypothetical protein
MIDRPNGCGQLDLLVRAANALEPKRMPPPIRMEVTLLLTRLMTEYLAVAAARPAVAANE